MKEHNHKSGNSTVSLSPPGKPPTLAACCFNRSTEPVVRVHWSYFIGLADYTGLLGLR
jgi:hypothetical protein